MIFFILDIEGTKEDIALNKSEAEANKAVDNLIEILCSVDLGIEPTLVNICGTYITSQGNAADYKEMYGWKFAKMEVMDI